MFFRWILLVVSLTNFLWDFYVSSCDENCADKPEFTPSILVVKFGDPTSASCSACQHDCIGHIFKIESNSGKTETSGTMITWMVNRLTEWDASPLCYYTIPQAQCCTTLPVTVYKPPDNVSISFDNHIGPMFEGHQYTLQCTVEEVAPIENLTVTFYKGQTTLGQLHSENITEKKPVTETFTLDITPSKEDDGAQYWCEAKLELGPAGPQPPPVVKSQKIPVTVYYEPQIESSPAHTITITEGDPLQLNCSAVGNPSPSYTWTLPSTHSSSLNSSIFTIDSVTAADEGPYNCSVSNIMGNVTVRFRVVVQGLTTTTLPTTTTTTATTAATTTTPKPTTTPNSATTSSALLHRFIMCFMLLFSTLGTLTQLAAHRLNNRVFVTFNFESQSLWPSLDSTVCITVHLVRLQDPPETMLSYRIFVVLSLNILRDLSMSVTGCDENCADKPEFTPSILVVKFGDSTSASCSACQHDCIGHIFKIESNSGKTETSGTMITWTVDRLTEWDASPLCYYTIPQAQCCTTLPVTVYKPPDNVSISFDNHTGPVFEGHQYTLQCTVEEIAPIENLTVTFYKGQTTLGQLHSENITEKKPVTETFTLDITPSKEDDGAQYWCEAKLELGPAGPQPPPVVKSQKIPVTVHYKPQIESLPPDEITITEGNPLQLNCSAVGKPSPSYTWKLPLDSPSPSNSSVLTISSVTFADEGLYTCTVSNSRGTVTVKFNVDVQVNMGIITAVIIGVFVLVMTVLSLLVYFYCYKPSRVGQYNLKDVFRLHARHSTVPCAE
ncbi:vascular cell adhesion protein 1-like [Epinephelus lanceolatus]|uniref:hemicentin-1-like n=1 Tax=Epinephelus lanceolatus TaxID=310571 RepID=UPI0014457638|nr:hemicentin-1-like [Epinephelus lanceolatus]